MDEIYIIIRIKYIDAEIRKEQIIYVHYEKELSFKMFNFLKLDNQNDIFEMQIHEKYGNIFELKDVIK
jgi:hypothetical protein